MHYNKIVKIKEHVQSPGRVGTKKEEKMSDTAVKKDELKRNVSGFNAYTMVVGTIIGTGIFFKPQAIFNATGTATLGLLSWVIGCFLGLCGGLIIAEIGSMITETGGLMTYIEKMYSEVFGFMVGWAQTICFYPIRMAASAVVFGTQFVALFGMDPKHAVIVSICLTIYLFLVNWLGNKICGYSINIATVLKFVPIILVILFGLFLNGDPKPIQWTPVVDVDHPLLQGLSVSVIAALYGTDGWINITNIAGELKDPQKNIPRALIGGLLTVTATYIIVNLAYLRAMTPAEMAGSATVASDAAGRLMGIMGQRIVAVGVLISILGSHTGFTRAAWRIPYALALRNWLPFSGWFGKLSEKTGMPVNSGIFMAALTMCGTVFIKDYNVLSDIGSYVIWFFYTMAFAGIFILRKRWKNVERPYSCPLYPVIPVIGILGGVMVLVSTTIYQPKIAAFSILLVVIGLPVYWYKKKQTAEVKEEVRKGELA